MKTLVNVIMGMFKIGNLESISKDVQLQTSNNFFSLQSIKFPIELLSTRKQKERGTRHHPIIQVENLEILNDVMLSSAQTISSSD